MYQQSLALNGNDDDFVLQYIIIKTDMFVSFSVNICALVSPVKIIFWIKIVNLFSATLVRRLLIDKKAMFILIMIAYRITSDFLHISRLPQHITEKPCCMQYKKCWNPFIHLPEDTKNVASWYVSYDKSHSVANAAKCLPVHYNFCF